MGVAIGIYYYSLYYSASLNQFEIFSHEDCYDLNSYSRGFPIFGGCYDRERTMYRVDLFRIYVPDFARSTIYLGLHQALYLYLSDGFVVAPHAQCYQGHDSKSLPFDHHLYSGDLNSLLETVQITVAVVEGMRLSVSNC